jgi:hypothetical protein
MRGFRGLVKWRLVALGAVLLAGCDEGPAPYERNRQDHCRGRFAMAGDRRDSANVMAQDGFCAAILGRQLREQEESLGSAPTNLAVRP